MNTNHKVGIIGAGNGGLALMFELINNGVDLLTYHKTEFSKTITPVFKADKIIFNKLGEITIFEPNNYEHLITNDLQYLIDKCDVIYNTLPINAHIELIKSLSNLHINKQLYLINLGGGFSPYFQKQFLPTNNFSNKIIIGSTSSLPYVCRVIKNQIIISGVKSYLDIAFLDHNADVTWINDLFVTALKFNRSILEVGFKNVNPINHPVICLFNLSSIDKRLLFRFYKDGITPVISGFMSKFDNERVLIAQAYGYNIPTDLVQDNIHYNTNFDSYYKYAQNTNTHDNIYSPLSISHRYITEDIPFGLVPLFSLAKLKGVETPNIDSVIKIFNSISEVDYITNGYRFTQDILNNI